MAKIKIIELSDETTGYESYLASEMWFENGDSYILEAKDAFTYSDYDIDFNIKHINEFIEKWKNIAEKEDFMFEVEKQVYEILEELKDEKE